MDASRPYSIPSVPELPKSWMRLYQLPVQVYAIKNHGWQNESCYFTIGQWASDPNFTISILYQNIKHYFQVSSKVPSVLYLQVSAFIIKSLLINYLLLTL